MSLHTREELVDLMTRSIDTFREVGRVDPMVRNIRFGDHVYREPKRVTEAKEALFGAAIEFLHT
jgi:galactokinase